jgi:hypothetical protein
LGIAVATALACSGPTDVDPPEPEPDAAPEPAPDRPDRGGRHQRGGTRERDVVEADVVQYGVIYDTSCMTCGDPPCVAKGVRASSTLTEGQLVHEAGRVLGDLATAWCEGGGDAGQGTSLTFKIPPGCGVYGVQLHGGYFKTAGHLKDNARIRSLELRSGSHRARAELDDPVDVPFDKASAYPAFVELRWDDPGPTLELVNLDVYLGASSPKDLCVSKVALLLFPLDR